METNVLKFLWKYISKLKLLALIISLAIIFESFFTRVSFYFIAKIVDLMSMDIPIDDILHKAIVLVLLAAGATILRNFMMTSCIVAEAKFLPVFRTIVSKDLFGYAHKHSTTFFDEEMAGTISGKIRTIIDSSLSLYGDFIWGFLQLIASFTITFFFIARINIYMALIMIGLVIVIIPILMMLSKVVMPYAKETAKAVSESNGVLVDSITNSSLVKSFSNYNFEKRNYFKFLKRLAKADRKETLIFAKMFFIQNFLKWFFEVTFFTIPVYFWYYGKITVGDFVLVQTLIFTVTGLFNRISHVFSHVSRRFGQIKDGLELLAKPYEITDIPNAMKISKKIGDIVFKDINYHYKTAKMLFKNFNLTIKKGEKVGLVGHSGAGKSTLVKLLTRNYDVQSGEILIGKHDIKKITQDSLRDVISLIPQDPSLFNRTIMENIRYGKIKATDNEVYAAARKAYCHDFIKALPNGYESKVGDRGVMLSGGERQRIAIARAILKNAPILILDEATSALDSASEKYIHESLKNLMKGKTVIAIAHRLSTLREMDRIVVLEKGKVVEEGSHMSLVRKKDGIYHNFYEMQSQGFLGLN